MIGRGNELFYAVVRQLEREGLARPLPVLVDPTAIVQTRSKILKALVYCSSGLVGSHGRRGGDDDER